MKSEDHPVIVGLCETGIIRPHDVDYLIEHGSAYQGAPLPPGLEQWGPGKCITASKTLAERHGWKRIQGWALLPPSVTSNPRPIFHCWNTADGETAIDASFPDPEDCYFFGLTMRHDHRIDEMIAGHKINTVRSIPAHLVPGNIARRIAGRPIDMLGSWKPFRFP